MGGFECVPVNTCPWHPGPNSSSRETAILKYGSVPGFKARGSQENFTARFHGAVKSLHLDEGLGVFGAEPVHAVHNLFSAWSASVDGFSCFLGGLVSYYSVAEGAWSNTADHFLELIGVDAKSVKCSRLGELSVCSV